MADLQFPPLNNPKQFELLTCDLFNGMLDTVTFKTFGKNGHRQKGIDVFSAAKTVAVQCKWKDLSRSAILIKKELFADIDDTVSKLLKNPLSVPFVDLFILTSASEHPDFDEYCNELKREKGCYFNITFWGWETIQRKLGGYPSILKTYYPDYSPKQSDSEQLVKTRLSMKKRLESDFADWLNYAVENRKRRSRMIIHSIDDTHYPVHVKNAHDEYQWYAAEINRLSKNGLGFFRQLTDIYVTNGGWWTEKKPENVVEFKTIRVARVDVVAFEDIVDYDLRGDEHYLCPHFYLRFRHNGQPFIETYYQNMEKEKGGFLFFDDTSKIDLL
ncbi:hypothetical protein [Mucilaginibacter sp. 44-25]|uniref:hypothetical protein n=1 Tax=Mucilaginibacter sp. 44-25 TaxID=1895794 RepID=UPI00096A18E9|nr:hypothetical protein [Mucilaginibacter sp. 44-25]OJW16880.1 MAG: hypothetical protein BGO48_10520 [Mucilaginibacter sp. 44-25]